MIEIYHCSKCGFPVTKICYDKLEKEFHKIKEQHRNVYSFYVKDGPDFRYIFVFLDIRCMRCNQQAKASFYSRFFEDSSKINIKEYNLIDVYPASYYPLDGIYPRWKIRELLSVFMRRWSYIAFKTILHSPFIGPFPKSNHDKTEDWSWILRQQQELYNLLIITRKNHANYLKKMPIFDKSTDNKTDWFNSFLQSYKDEDLEDVISERIYKPLLIENNIHIYNKSHAKFYAGLIDGFAEVIITSYNIFKQGPIYGEAFTLKIYPFNFFYEKFLIPLEISQDDLNFLPSKYLEKHEHVPVIVYKEIEGKIEAISDKCPITRWDIVYKYTR